VDARIVLVCTATGDRSSADAIAAALVTERLAACVQITPVESCYRWKNEIHTETEVRLDIKTVPARLPAIEALLARLHPYELPELTVLPVLDGSDAFLRWVEENAEPG
jgi:periplasmic divalent cation tolerance protein